MLPALLPIFNVYLAGMTMDLGGMEPPEQCKCGDGGNGAERAASMCDSDACQPSG